MVELVRFVYVGCAVRGVVYGLPFLLFSRAHGMEALCSRSPSDCGHFIHNVRGIKLVGRVVTVMELAILAVVLVMCLMSVRMWHHNPFSPVIPPHTRLFPVFGVGFALGL